MTPLSIEIYNPRRSERVPVGEVKPGDAPGSISSNLPGGEREVYVFMCGQDDRSSTIYRSPSGADIAVGEKRAVIKKNELEVVGELRRGDKPLELEIKTDQSPKARKIRFVHR